VRTIAIVPAREQSKGIPRKNLKYLCGKPLVLWTVEQALATRGIDEVVVSSDWADLLQVITWRTKATPLRRPAHLATDTATTESVIDHVLDKIEADRVVLLQPTSPNRRPNDITDALTTYDRGGYDSLLSAVRWQRFLWWERGPEGDRHVGPLNYTLLTKRPRRQEMSTPQWLENGSIYIFDVRGYQGRTADDVRQENNRLFGRVGVHEMPAWTALELDEPDDWDEMERVMYRQGLAREAMRV
jgi:CMP-N,N'-diacetyllegionaminic acid synthase